MWELFGFVLLLTLVVLLPQLIIWCTFGSTYGSQRCFRRIPRLIVVLAIFGTLAGTAGHYHDIQYRTRIAKVRPTGNEQALAHQLKADLREEWRKLGVFIALGTVTSAGCILCAATGAYGLGINACGATALFAAVIGNEIWEINDLKYQLRKLGH